MENADNSSEIYNLTQVEVISKGRDYHSRFWGTEKMQK